MEEEKRLEVYGGSREDIGMKTYLHGPMDFAKKLKPRFRVGDMDLPERRKRYASSREEEDVATGMFPVRHNKRDRSHVVGECEIYKEERDVLEEMRKLDVCICDMKEFGRLLVESSEKTIAIQGDGRRPQPAKQDGDRTSKQFSYSIWKKRNDRPNVGGVSTRGRDGASSRNGCVVDGHMTKASNK